MVGINRNDSLLRGEERCVTTLITAAKETTETTEVGVFFLTDHFGRLSLKFETLYMRPRSLVQSEE